MAKKQKMNTVSLSEAKTLVPQTPQVVPFEFVIPEGMIPVGDVQFDTMNHVVELRQQAKDAYRLLKSEQERLENTRKQLEKVQPQAIADYSAAKNALMALPGMAYLRVLLSSDNAVRSTEKHGWEEKIKDELAKQNKVYRDFLALKHEIAVTQQWIDENAGKWMDLYTAAKQECNEFAEAANREDLRYEVLFPQKKKVVTA